MFRNRIVDRNIAVFEKYPKVFFLIDCIIKSIRCLSFWKNTGIIYARFYPRKEFLHKRLDRLFSHIKALLSN